MGPEHKLLTLSLQLYALCAGNDFDVKTLNVCSVRTGIRVLITMLPACAHVREAYCGKDGILSADGALAAMTGFPPQYSFKKAHIMFCCLS